MYCTTPGVCEVHETAKYLLFSFPPFLYVCLHLIFVCACVADLVQNPLHAKRSSMCFLLICFTIKVRKVDLKPDLHRIKC